MDNIIEFKGKKKMDIEEEQFNVCQEVKTFIDKIETEFDLLDAFVFTCSKHKETGATLFHFRSTTESSSDDIAFCELAKTIVLKRMGVI